MNLCLFDLDETLLPIDSDHAWGDFVIRLGWVDEAAFRRGNDAFFAQYKAGCLDIRGYIAFATGPLRERSVDELNDAHARFMAEVIRPQIRPEALALVDMHRRQGDELLMVTATNDFITAPIARAFGIDHLLATRLERDERGTITGRIAGTPNYREGKVARVNEWLAARGTDWASCGRVTVYSDSVNDLPLLEAATVPVVTNAGAALDTIAKQRGWRLLKLFSLIKAFIDRLLGKSPKAPGAAAAPSKRGAPKPKRVEVPKAEHGVDPGLVDERAVKVVKTLTDAGHEAYIVGGAVRDLLLGLRPKDFDVATDATPEQVKALFRRAFIIGRRFRIVHVVFGRGRQDRGLSEVIEVSTFRALMAPAAAEPEAGQGAAAATGHVIDAAGRVLRDNVWGPQIEDAARRDFTVNAMYYDPQREIVVDYHGGIKDAAKKLLRMIGDPETRYREDPVRIIRAIRFAAKLGFEIEPKTRAPIHAMAALLDSVPASRMFDEMIKLLQTGHALASLEELRKQGLHRGTFPILDVALDEAHRHDGHQKFVQLALADTDRRVNEGKPVAPSFMLACLLWHDVLSRWDELKARGEPAFGALQQAVEAVFDARIGDISGRGKLAGDMREIWLMQPRFDRRSGNAPRALVEQPRFRAGFDFLRLRATCGEADAALAAWWEDFSLADEARRGELLDVARGQEPSRRRGPRPPAARAGRSAEQASERPVDAQADEPVGDDALDADADAPLDADPAKKRRRRRRKPAVRDAGAALPDAGSAEPASGSP